MTAFRNIYILKILNFISLSILLLNIVNSSIYTHAHQLANGEIVVHAHPFNKQQDDSPFKSHKHSTIEYVILNTFNLFLTSNFLFVALGIFTLYTKKYFILKPLHQQRAFHYSKKKSPPYKIVT